MTNDVAGAMRFYAELFGWEYRIEHAAECAWIGEEADYPMGAVIGVYPPAHDVPPPRGTFVWDALVSDDAAAASSYYGTLFGWGVERKEGEPIIFKRAERIGCRWRGPDLQSVRREHRVG
jgi:predicted enzyme related to lactoylglutathione lyase